VVYGLERFAAAFSDAELLQSSEDVPVLRRLRVPDQRIAVLGNGIDLGRFSPPSSADRLAARAEIGLADDEVAVGVVGRLVWEKGLREVMAMAAELRRSRPGARVLVAGGVEPDKGDGLVEADLERVSAESGVVFLGERRPIERLYDALDVYVLASYREGFPRSAMEAAAQGLPLVVTDIRGCRQVVDPERNGLLVPVADPTSLTSAVTRLVDDPALRDRMGEASVAKAAADFDQRSVIDLTLATYRRLLAEGA
jgi:glycosyltransferase involved in cell wall biosynthesis